MLFLSDSNVTRIFWTDFRRVIKYQISWKAVQWKPRCSMWTDRETNMTKLIVAFRNFADAPYNRLSLWKNGMSHSTTSCGFLGVIGNVVALWYYSHRWSKIVIAYHWQIVETWLFWGPRIPYYAVGTGLGLPVNNSSPTSFKSKNEWNSQSTPLTPSCSLHENSYLYLLRTS